MFHFKLSPLYIFFQFFVQYDKVIHIRFEKKHFKHLFLVALFQPILYFIFETFGIRLTTSGEAGMMIALIPIFVTILSSVILKEAPKKIQIFFILLSVSGVLFIQIMKSSSGLDVNLWGLLLLLGAVISAALFNIASRNASKTLKPYELTYFMMLGGALVFNTLYIIQLSIESRLGDYFTNLSHLELVVPILYFAFLSFKRFFPC